MKIQRLKAENFRNLKPEIIEFVSGVNCIFGSNGNGKTNLLEAVYYLTNKKSFRKSTGFPQLINIEGENPEIYLNSVFIDEQQSHSLSVKINSEMEYWWLNNRPDRKDFKLQSVFVNPFDSYLFHTSSSFRRQWFDSHLAQLDPKYKKALARYHKALKFRNSLLASGYHSSSKIQLMAIDEEYSQLIEELTNLKNQWIKELNEFLKPTFKNIFAEEHELELQVESRFQGLHKKNINEFLRKNEEKEFNAHHSLYGVHRDDYSFLFDGLNSYEFCSLGQQK
jgi:DNA replication and repair protein RecF